MPSRLGEYDGGANVVASRPAEMGTALVVGAHFDAVPGVPGADDNASGVVLQLAAARALSACTLAARAAVRRPSTRRRLGLVGSRAYVGRLRNEGRAVEIQGMLNLDMMGYDSDDDGGYTIFECGRPEAAFLIDTLIDRTRALDLGSEDKPRLRQRRGSPDVLGRPHPGHRLRRGVRAPGRRHQPLLPPAL